MAPVVDRAGVARAPIAGQEGDAARDENLAALARCGQRLIGGDQRKHDGRAAQRGGGIVTGDDASIGEVGKFRGAAAGEVELRVIAAHIRPARVPREGHARFAQTDQRDASLHAPTLPSPGAASQSKGRWCYSFS